MYLHDLTSTEWCDLIFEGRNKAYGAYILRQKSAQRYRRAMIFVLALFLFLGLGIFIASRIVSQRMKEAIKEVEAFAKMKAWEKEQDKTLHVIAAGRRVPQATVEEPTALEVPTITDEELVEIFGGTGEKEAVDASFTAEAVAPNDTLYNAEREDLPEQGILLTPTEVVEEMPQFPGGIEALVRFFDEHITYPPAVIRKKVQGEMEVSFYVDKEGNVTEPSITKSFNRVLDRQALEACKLLPQWKPGRSNGRVSIVRVTVPIKFCLK